MYKPCPSLILVGVFVLALITSTSSLSFITCSIMKNFYVNYNCVHAKQPVCTNIMNFMSSKILGRRNCAYEECDTNNFERCVSNNACPQGTLPTTPVLREHFQHNGKCVANPPDSCEEIKQPEYNNIVISHNLGFKVVCDTVSDGGGWTIIQRRFDGSQDFDQDWESYEEGFGDMNEEFWMGFNDITKLLALGKHEIRFEIQLADGKRKFVQYRKFSSGGKDDKYRLHISRWDRDRKSTADGKSIEAHNGMAFSTKDVDNDKCRCSCASSGRGGWWYKRCLWSNLNGSWGNRFMSRGPLWVMETGLARPLISTRIKIRRLQ